MGAPIQHGPYRIMTFRDFVPDRLRFVILLFASIAFQFSGGVYLASVSQMVGGKVLLQEDIMMAGYVSFIGMTMIFPLLFRIKFCFKPRNTLMFTAGMIAALNVITMYTQNLAILMTASFIVGALRMVGSFECFSTLQLKITPSRNMTVFFCAIYLIVTGAIQLCGITTVYIDYFFTWQYMHVLVVGLLIVAFLCFLFLMKNVRLGKKLPLYGIDYMGCFLWTAFLISTVFVFQYGRYLDWFDSAYIRIGAVISLLALLLAIRQMLVAKRPYINPQLFGYRNLKTGLILALAMMLLLNTSSGLENQFIYGIMHYDSLNAISLNWWVLAGIVIGAVFAWYTLVVLKMRYKTALFIGFTCLVAYQMIFYFIIDPRLNIEMLYPMSVLRGIGYVILYVALVLYTTEHIPFTHFFHALCLIGFIRTGIGSPLGSSLITNWMVYLTKKNTMLLGASLDAVNPAAASLTTETLYSEVNRQAMLVSMKEILGWFAIGGLVVLLFILTMQYIRPAVRIIPRMKYMRRYVRTRLREMQTTS